MTPSAIPVLVICGPTACGKTRLAVSLARELSGEIISADSRQVYRGMDIGTGKDLSEYHEGGTAVPVHCIDCVDPGTVFSLSSFQKSCSEALADIAGRGRLPIICGGTGLYIEAILRRYDIPDVPEDSVLRSALMQEDKAVLAERLRAGDGELFARTDISSHKRIVRALEILTHRGDVSTPPQRPERPVLNACVIGLHPGRSETLRRIDERLAYRLEHGMISEVQTLHDSGISWERLDSFGMEYRFVSRHLQGLLDYESMTSLLATAIHQLAKRQMTFFRGFERRGIPVSWIESPEIPDVLRIWNSFKSNASQYPE